MLPAHLGCTRYLSHSIQFFTMLSDFETAAPSQPLVKLHTENLIIENGLYGFCEACFVF